MEVAEYLRRDPQKDPCESPSFDWRKWDRQWDDESDEELEDESIQGFGRGAISSFMGIPPRILNLLHPRYNRLVARMVIIWRRIRAKRVEVPRVIYDQDDNSDFESET
ncbi:hypothetical protein FRC17_009248, partial [Serendipita sp. 399]